MKQWGVTLIFIGLGSFVLPMIGLQFRLLNLLGGKPAAGIFIAAVGGVLLALSFMKDRASVAQSPDSTKERRGLVDRAVSQSQSQPIKVTGMRCAACGAENTQGDQFCGGCGAPLAQVASLSAAPCTRCGAPLSPDERFCGECGAPLGKTLTPPRIRPYTLAPIVGIVVLAGLGFVTYQFLLGSRQAAPTSGGGIPQTFPPDAVPTTPEQPPPETPALTEKRLPPVGNPGSLVMRKTAPATRAEQATAELSLLEAAKTGSIDVVKMLLDEGVDPNAKDKDGGTALMEAAIKGHTVIVNALLNKGANVNAKDKHANTALMAAASAGHTDIVRALLNKGADANAKMGEGFTSLMQAAGEGHADIVDALLIVGANVNAKNQNGDTALIWAAAKGHAAVVRALLNKGADVKAKDNGGSTALSLARMGGRTEIVQILKQAGANE